MNKAIMACIATSFFTTQAIADDCKRLAIYQVAGEPGIHECVTHKPISDDCMAVIKASVTKRTHECQVVRHMLAK